MTDFTASEKTVLTGGTTSIAIDVSGVVFSDMREGRRFKLLP